MYCTNACQHKIHEMIWHNIKAACRTKILFAYKEREKKTIYTIAICENGVDLHILEKRKKSSYREGKERLLKNTVNIT